MELKRYFKIKEITFEYVIVILFSVLPVVDSANGYLIEHGISSVGTVYKMFLLLLLLVKILGNRQFLSSYMLMLLAVVGYTLSTIGINLAVSGEGLISSDFPIKLIFNVMTFAFLMECQREGVLTGKAFYRILDNSCWLMIICILVPYVLGVGNAIYAGDLGYRGFFYSQNELNVMLIILFYFCLYKVICRMNLISLLQLGGITVCLLLLSSKSSMAACALGAVVFLIEYMRRKASRHKLVLIGIVIVAAALGLSFVMDQIADFMTRQNTLSSMYGGSVIATLTSGRVYYLEDAWSALITNQNWFLRLLIGNGFCSEYLVEMDLLDIFFYLGIIGVVATAAFLLGILVKSIKNCRSDRTVIRIFAMLLIFLYAFFTGHVLFMASSGCYFVILCCFDLTYQLEEGTAVQAFGCSLVEPQG